MSEQIKITIVMCDEKPNGKKGGDFADKMTLTQTSAMTLMPVLLKNGLMDGSFCGGRGDCGRCVVQFLKGAPLPTGLERNRLEPEELRQGYRLACVARPTADCTIKIVGTEDVELPIVTEINFLSEKNDRNSQEKSLTEKQKSNVTESNADEEEGAEKKIKKSSVISETKTHAITDGNMDEKDGTKNNKCYILAVDLGTTTIAMQLREVATGAVADTYCEINPQRRYGTDVLARIQASVEGHGEELRRLVCGVILRGLGQFAENLQKILCMCIAGNTAMEHLLLGIDVSSLGRAPFVPVEKGLRSITAARLFMGMENRSENLCITGGGRLSDFPVYIAPCISAFVGGDIVAGLYALGLCSPSHSEKRKGSGRIDGMEELSEAKLREKETGNGGKAVLRTDDRGHGKEAQDRKAVLFVDLGTNGEMAVTDGKRMIVTATAAGPAFEGDGTMMGADRIALTARLLKRGILDETGLLAEPYFTEGVKVEGEREVPVTDKQIKNICYFNQKDIRAIQMAKAAVRAGVEILWEEMGCPEIEKVFLAGGFGYYLDVEAAVAIGLLPSYMRGRVHAAGNTSLAGAYELGRDLWGNRLDAALLEGQTCLAKSVNLAETERFEGLYLKYMNLEEN